MARFGKSSSRIALPPRGKAMRMSRTYGHKYKRFDVFSLKDMTTVRMLPLYECYLLSPIYLFI